MTRKPGDAPLEGGLTGGEEALIAEFWAPLTAGYAGARALKDDAATIAAPPGEELVVTTDALIAGVHFFPDEDAFSVGWKALAVNVSDLLAKAAAPFAYVMNVALPESVTRDWLNGFAQGLGAAQSAFGCRLIGGDTDRTPGPLSVSITAFGTVPSGSMLPRSSARVGDRVYVTGTIGDATLGLALRRDPAAGARWRCTAEAATYLAGRFSRPQPPIAIVAALRAGASAGMDISDGLMKDFGRLCSASSVGGRIEAARVPFSDAARAAIEAGVAPTELMAGGEDYEVLACVPEPRASTFETMAAESGTRVTCIGSIEAAEHGIAAFDSSGAPLHFPRTGWDHFA
ncbi:MAG TPA: thiamine-phosphate kinase [Hyphomicrobium sp.]|nr:thiamine-phosphate kinase [Hyphomicrobium sp.]